MQIPESPLLTRLAAKLWQWPARPPLKGRKAVPGLSRDVSINWTEGGVAHLGASGARDLFFAQGYVTAADRLFQMDLTRRMARGELAEIMGDRPAPWQELTTLLRGWSLVDADQFLRQLGLVGAARASVEALSPEGQSLLDAYAAGVNAYMAEGTRPLECQLLGYRPRPWSAIDSALVWKALAFQLSYGWRAGLVAEALRTRFADDPERARALMPDQRDVTDVVLPRWEGASFALKVLENVAGKRGAGGNGLGGSNGWVIAPGRTASGRAMLCGDPHLPLRAPTPGYLVHLSGGGFDVAGWSVPGVPGVLMGHNARVAWTITSGCTLDATWALEQPSSDGASVRTATGYEPIDLEHTDIVARGEKSPFRRVLRFGPNGPIFDAKLLGDGTSGLMPALRWTGHLPTPDLDAMLAMNRAGSGDELRTAADKYGSPAVNLLYADVDGHIGWRLAGVAPRFKGQPPNGAVAGWLPEHDWDGVHGSDEMPSLVDPAAGFIASANQRVRPAKSAVQLGELFEPPYRARRIRKLLEESQAWTLDGLMAVQQDRHSGFGVDFQERFLRPYARRLVGASERPQGASQEVLARALAWNGDAAHDSAEAAAMWAFASALARALFEPVLGEELYLSLFEHHNLVMLPMLRVLEKRGAPFWTPDAMDRAALLALGEAAAELTRVCGGPPEKWRLGALRTVAMKHPMSRVPGLTLLVTLGPVPHGGDGSSVNAAFAKLGISDAADVGPAFRHAVTCGEWDDYRVVLATGQSGDPASMRYRDHFPVWRAGGHFVLPFSPEAVKRASQGAAVLVAPEP